MPRRNRSRAPTPVSSVRAVISCRRRSPGRSDPLCTLTGPVRTSSVGQQARRTPSAATSASAARDPPLDVVAVRPARPHQPVPTLGKHPQSPSVILALDWMGRSPWNPRDASRRRAPPRRTATSAAHAAPAIPELSRSPRWITHVAVIIPGPNPRQNDHWNTGKAELRRTPGRATAGTPAPASSAATRAPKRPEPSDLSPTA